MKDLETVAVAHDDAPVADAESKQSAGASRPGTTRPRARPCGHVAPQGGEVPGRSIVGRWIARAGNLKRVPPGFASLNNVRLGRWKRRAPYQRSCLGGITAQSHIRGGTGTADGPPAPQVTSRACVRDLDALRLSHQLRGTPRNYLDVDSAVRVLGEIYTKVHDDFTDRERSTSTRARTRDHDGLAEERVFLLQWVHPRVPAPQLAADRLAPTRLRPLSLTPGPLRKASSARRHNPAPPRCRPSPLLHQATGNQEATTTPPPPESRQWLPAPTMDCP